MYVMSAGHFTKVGISSKLERRVRALQLKLTEPLSLVASFSAPSRRVAQALEKKCHVALASSRLVGTEWFALPAENCRQVVEGICKTYSADPIESSSRSDDSDRIVIREMLAAIRREAGLTQRALADRLKRNKNYVDRVESGDQIPDAVECREWAKACGVRPWGFWWRLEKTLKRHP